MVNSYPKSSLVKLEVDEGDCGERWLMAHTVSLQQALVNILTNSLKFTEIGEVSLKCEYDESSKRVLFEVRDTGIGISKEFLEHGLFEPFKQEQSSLRAKYRGVGLGMPLSKKLIERMNGTIEVKSQKFKGTTTIVSLPATDPPKDTANVLEEVVEDDTLSRTLTQVNALIVDDNSVNRKLALGKRQLKWFPIQQIFMMLF